jgi:hypothetical protein
VKEEENGRSEEAEENGDEDSADEETGAISRTGTESQAAEQEANKYYKHPLWLLGMFLVICNAFLDVAAFGFAPQSMLSPMGALTLVFNTVLAPKLLGETLSRRDIFGTAVIVAGTVITVSFAPRATPEYTVSIIRDLYMRFVVLVYGCVVVGASLPARPRLARRARSPLRRPHHALLPRLLPLRRRGRRPHADGPLDQALPALLPAARRARRRLQRALLQVLCRTASRLHPHREPVRQTRALRLHLPPRHLPLPPGQVPQRGPRAL